MFYLTKNSIWRRITMSSVFQTNITLYSYHFFYYFSGDRFWQLLLRTPTSLYLHSVPVLSSARSYFRGPIRNAHRYVEPGLHLGRTFDRVSFASRRRRRWPIVMYHWASWNASSEIVGPKQKGQKLYQLKR